MSEWQPMETAPKDGSTFLIFEQCEGMSAIATGSWSPAAAAFVDDAGLWMSATHWMPLPEPPK